MTKKQSIYCAIVLFLIIWGACAKVVSPTGGPEDKEPPKILGSFPEAGSKNIKDNEFSIDFDEYVELSDPSQIVVSPYTDPPPEIKIKGKSVVIKFEENLQKDITYNIDFKDAIQDINERNTLEGYSFVFSTGETIDSIELQGNAFYSADGKPVDNALIGLYPANTDSLFLKEAPLYIARTDKEGNYSIRHIKAGTYELTALEDKNFNNYFDLPNELIAFQDSNIVLQDSQSYLVNLQLFVEASNNRALNVDNATFGKTIVELAQINDIVETRWLGESGLKDSFSVAKLEENKLEISTFYKNTNPQKILLLEAGVPFDTVELKPQDFSAEDFILETNVIGSRGLYLGQGDTLKLSGNYWLKSADLSNAVLKLKDSIDLPLTASPIRLTESEQNIKIFYDWQLTDRYQLIVPDSTITSVFGQTNADSLIVNFTLRDTLSYGDLTMKIVNFDTLDNPSLYFYQLRDRKKEIERGILQDSLVFFQQLLAGKYEFFITEDLNQNGKWDSGDYLTRKQPERIFKPEIEIDVKARWENEYPLSIE